MNIDSTNIETLVKRYVLNQMDESQAEAFESYYLARPDVVEKIAAAQKIRLGLEVLASESSTKTNNVLTENRIAAESDESSLITRLLAWMTVPVPSYAMLAALAILAPLALNNNASNKIRTDNGIHLVRIDAPSVRSFEESKGVDLTANGKQPAIIIRVKSVDYPQYKLSVSANGEKTSLWNSGWFEFASGTRDHLIVIPSQAAIGSANVHLFAVNEQGEEIEVPFCNYTEACF